jgi:RecA-family ATPase
MSIENVSAKHIVQPDFVITAQELIENDIIEIPWFLDKLIPMGGLTVVSGSSDTGKSTFLRQMAMALVSGREDYIGQRFTTKHRSVIYVSTEDDLLSLSPRIKVEKNYFSATDDYANLRFIFDYEGINEKLREAYERQPADCIILDAFGDLFDGDPNSASSTRGFMNPYKAMADEFRCAIIFLHHNRKSAGTTSPDKNDLLGSMAIEAKARSVLMLSQPESRPDRRTLKVVKGNYLTPDEKKVVYDLSFVNGLFDLGGMQSSTTTTTSDEHIKELVYKMRDDGLSLRNISEAAKNQGIDISKSTVSRIINK